MISYEIVDDSTQVLFNRTVNSGLEVLEMIKPLVVNVSGSNKMNIVDAAGQVIDLLWTEVATPSSTNIADLESQLLAFNNTVPSGGSSRVIASLENVNLKDIAANPLTWATGKTAANTAATGVVVTLAEADTYADDTTAFQLQLNSVEILLSGGTPVKDFISLLVSGKTFCAPFVGEGSIYQFSNSGNWALPVTQGTLNDFRVNIYILGDTI